MQFNRTIRKNQDVLYITIPFKVVNYMAHLLRVWASNAGTAQNITNIMLRDKRKNRLP